jgi:methyltransferase family protein
VDFLARLAGSGAVLESAIGIGRVGVPLVEFGVSVTGIELSAPMATQLRQKVDEAHLAVAIGGMATTSVPGEFSLVYLVCNTLSNLRTQAEQVECFRNAARHLGTAARSPRRARVTSPSGSGVDGACRPRVLPVGGFRSLRARRLFSRAGGRRRRATPKTAVPGHCLTAATTANRKPRSARQDK